MFRTYDDWKLATPPEYDEASSSLHEEMGEPPRKEDDEDCCPPTLRVPYSRPGMGMRDKRSE